MDYMCMLHNRVNKRLKKSIFDCDIVTAEWGTCDCFSENPINNIKRWFFEAFDFEIDFRSDILVELMYFCKDFIVGFYGFCHESSGNRPEGSPSSPERGDQRKPEHWSKSLRGYFKFHKQAGLSWHCCSSQPYQEKWLEFTCWGYELCRGYWKVWYSGVSVWWSKKIYWWKIEDFHARSQ